MSLLMGWLAKARRPAAVTARAHVLTYPRAILIVGFVCSGFFVLLATLAGIFARGAEWWTPFVFIAFVPLGATLIGEALRVRHVLTEAGIVYQGLWKRYEKVPWEEVESASWSPSMKWLVLTTRDPTRAALFRHAQRARLLGAHAE
jgi:hypothetical protein